jgi:ActR/RegA family two-component response regulator
MPTALDEQRRLEILMAVSQDVEIADALRFLSKRGHRVRPAHTFQEAMSDAQTKVFHMAVIELDWFADETCKLPEFEARTAGWQIAEAVKERHSNLGLILYSKRANDPDISNTALKNGMFPIQKSSTTQRQLANAVELLLKRLEIENDHKIEIKELEAKLNTTNAENEELRRKRDMMDREFHQIKREKDVEKEKADSEKEKAKSRFGRVFLIALIVPTVVFVLFISAWLTTQQPVILISAFMAGAFLVLVILAALDLLNLDFIKVFLEFLTSFRKNHSG